MNSNMWTKSPNARRYFIGGSDARVIMGSDEAALLRLWREKRGETKPEDLSGNLIVQLGLATEDLNRRCEYRSRHHGHMAQLQHNMWVVASRTAVLSVITGGGKWVEITIYADPLYQHLIVTAERKFWRCVESGEPPRLFGVEPPEPRIQAVRIVDMSGSNAWAEFAGIFARTRAAYLEHEQAKAELKGLMPEDAKEAIGHGVRAKRSKSGAVSFDLLVQEGNHAAVE
jgi:predicted phage-related endonuclease